MWDPRSRPTSTQALNHEYFNDAIDPLRPKSSASRVTSKRQSEISIKSSRDSADIAPSLTSKPSWFRKSLIGRESSAPSVQPAPVQPVSSRPAPVHTQSTSATLMSKGRPNAEKRATWANGVSTTNMAPMPILPTIRPISPLSDAVTAQAHGGTKESADGNGGTKRGSLIDETAVKKIGRQLSVASNGNHYAEIHRQEAERALNGNGSGLASPANGQKESFFSHLRKRARRLSARHQTPLSPPADDIEANAGCGPWSSNRSSMAIDPPMTVVQPRAEEFRDLDKALQNVRYSVENTTSLNVGASSATRQTQASKPSPNMLKRQHSLPHGQQTRSVSDLTSVSNPPGPVSSRTRRALQMSTHPVHRYETPDEEEELLDEMLASTQRASFRLDQSAEVNRNLTTTIGNDRTPLRQSASNLGLSNTNPYPTPSPSAKRNSIIFGQNAGNLKPLDIRSGAQPDEHKWPTPPYEENEWATAAAASIAAAGAAYR